MAPANGSMAEANGSMAEANGSMAEANGSMAEANGSMAEAISSMESDHTGAPTDRTIARARALGIEAPLGDAFSCVIPGHLHQARLKRSARGLWRYHCDGASSHGLAEVRAFLGYDKVRPIAAIEAARWRERLDYEAGLREARPVRLSIPDEASPATRRIAHGLALFLALRDETPWDLSDPFTWARDFVMAYCTVSNAQARYGVGELREWQVIVPATTPPPPGSRKPILWRLALGLAAVGASGAGAEVA